MSKFSISDITNQDTTILATTILTNSLRTVNDNSSVLDNIVYESVQGCCE